MKENILLDRLTELSDEFGFESSKFIVFYKANVIKSLDFVTNLKNLTISYIESLDFDYPYDTQKVLDVARIIARRNCVSYNGSNIKYYYKGVSVLKYCKIKGLNYFSVINTYNRGLRGKRFLSIDRIIHNIEVRNYLLNFKYNGKSYDEILDLIKIKPPMFFECIVDMCMDSTDSLDLIITRVIESNFKKVLQSSYLTYKGANAKVYCLENGINFRNVYSYYTNLRKLIKYSAFSDEDLMELSVDYCVNKYKREDFYYKGVLLVDYCNENNLNYEFVYNRIMMSLPLIGDLDKFIDDVIDQAVYLSTDDNIINHCISISKHCINNSVGSSTFSSRTRNLVLMGYNKFEATFKNSLYYDLPFEPLFDFPCVNFDSILEDLCGKYGVIQVDVEELISKGYSIDQALKIIYLFGDRASKVKFMTSNSYMDLNSSLSYCKTGDETRLFNIYRIFKCGLLSDKGLYFNNIYYYVISRLSVFEQSLEYSDVLSIYIFIINFFDRTAISNELHLLNLVDLLIEDYFDNLNKEVIAK